MLDEVEINQGYQVLDFGCGPATFTEMIAEKIGNSGKLYALDIHPLAIKTVEKLIKKSNYRNVHTILSKCDTHLAPESLDLVIIFDVFHILNNQSDVLNELHRVLKQSGIMCFSDHHMKEEDILKKLSENGLFQLLKKGKMTFSFSKM
jgi:ubiquinone/menaquinone biosynthesis C-methylase UbiE